MTLSKELPSSVKGRMQEAASKFKGSVLTDGNKVIVNGDAELLFRVQDALDSPSALPTYVNSRSEPQVKTTIEPAAATTCEQPLDNKSFLLPDGHIAIVAFPQLVRLLDALPLEDEPDIPVIEIIRKAWEGTKKMPSMLLLPYLQSLIPKARKGLPPEWTIRNLTTRSESQKGKEPNLHLVKIGPEIVPDAKAHEISKRLGVKHPSESFLQEIRLQHIRVPEEYPRLTLKEEADLEFILQNGHGRKKDKEEDHSKKK